MNEFYMKLDKLYSAGDFSEIESFILDAVAKAGDGSPECAGLYNELASFYKGISRYDESEDAFAKSLNIFESLGMGTTPEYATVLLNLAGVHRLTGNAEKAIELFRDVMKRLEDTPQSYAYVSALNNLALAYQSQGDHAKALEYAEEALKLMRVGIGSRHEIATSLNNLAAIRMSLGQPEEADQLVSESLEIYESFEEPDAHHVAALSTKAALQYRFGDYNGALNGFQRALVLTHRFFGENIEYAICKRNISDVYAILGDKQAAMTEISDAVQIMEKLLGTDHQAVKDARKKLERLG